MAIKTKRPPMKETVGAQYLCFNTMDTDGRWTSTFAEEVEKTEVVKSVKVTENGEPTDTYASGAVYDSDITTTSTDIEVEIVAFPADTLAKLRGDNVDTDGIISKIAPVLGPIKTGFAAVNAVMAANPILIIIAAVAALIAIFVTLYNKCEWFRDGVNAIFGAVADFIKGAIDKIKGFFDFDWKLPKIKLPHFKASGEWSLSPLKVPKFSVDWYANGGILNSPTIFGANGDSLMGGGEAGKEAVLPIKLLKDYIREENDANNATLAAMIVEAFKSISMTAENNIYIGDKKSITLLTNLVLKQMANKTLATQGAKGK